MTTKQTDLRKPTIIVTIVAAVGLILYDIAPFASAPDHDTISEVLRDWGAASSALPYALGFLLGHWFWQGKRWLPHWAALSASAAVAGGLHLADVHPAVAVLFGVVGGRLLWPLSRREDEPPPPKGENHV